VGDRTPGYHLDVPYHFLSGAGEGPHEGNSGYAYGSRWRVVQKRYTTIDIYIPYWLGKICLIIKDNWIPCK
jgi:hypothetical protein